MASVAERAGIGHVYPHLLRHAAATLMSEAGMRLEDVSDTLGHRSVMVPAESYRGPVAPVRIANVGAMDQLIARREPAKDAGSLPPHREALNDTLSMTIPWSGKTGDATAHRPLACPRSSASGTH